MNTGIHNEAITHLAMQQRQIPVLIDSNPEEAVGYVPRQASSGAPATKTNVRLLDPEYVRNLNKSDQRRKEIETEHGAINSADWIRLRDLLDLRDRLNAGDWSPSYPNIMPDICDLAEPLLNALRSPTFTMSATLFTDQSGGAVQVASNDSSESLNVELRSAPCSETAKETHEWILEETYQGQFGPVTARTPITQFSEAGEFHFVLRPNVETKLVLHRRIIQSLEEAEFALSKAFTAGMREARFVVWWHNYARKLVPGLYCPDILSALYAIAMWSSGTAGGWAICQKCKLDYPRRRAKQKYCTSNCQAAAAMQRRRDKLKLNTKSDVKPSTKVKEPTGMP